MLLEYVQSHDNIVDYRNKLTIESDYAVIVSQVVLCTSLHDIGKSLMVLIHYGVFIYWMQKPE